MYELLIIYQIKHFLCDYPLQGQYMLGKFKPWPDFIKPLATHALVHGVATFLIALAFNPRIAFWVALLDTVVHFAVDRVKASPNLLGRFKPLTASTYKMAYNMSQGLGMISGDSMTDKLDQEKLKAYKIIGRKDIRANTFFWWSLGADQMAHHLTHYLIIFLLLK